MDINAITSIIGSLGFPIFLCIFFIKYIQEKDKKHDEQQDKMISEFFDYIKENQKEQAKTAEALNNLEIAITKLNEKIEKIGIDKEDLK